MTSKERAALRTKANKLDAIIQIGKDGVSEALIKQVDETLNARELIKIRVHLETSPVSPKDCAFEISNALGAEVIQVIGGIIVIYREIDQEVKAQKEKKAIAKKQKPKKTKIKGLRQRQREKEEKNPYLKYEYRAFKRNRDR